jgi:LAO/AO transport system kinase
LPTRFIEINPSSTKIRVEPLLYLQTMNYRKRNRLSAEDYIQGILKGDRIILSKSITVIESSLAEDNHLAEQILEGILPHTGNSIRVGITGVPGVGKSTFIESFGKHITSLNKKLAVLTIDPSSQRSKGSILGDKTRMVELATDPLAYIRPSASGSALGGVANKTRESMLLCEAAGFDVIFIETVGVGQSETSVYGMVDFFLLLMLAGAGDELQGIKKGIMEMADTIAITKADRDNIHAANRAKAEYQNALHLFPASASGWYPKVLTCSAVEKKGIRAIWETIEEHHQLMWQKGHFDKKRMDQHIDWMHETIRLSLERSFYYNPEIKQKLGEIEQLVAYNKMPVLKAARTLLEMYFKR